MNYKICTGCGTEFLATLNHFYKDKKGKYGVASKCKQCHLAIAYRWKLNNPNCWNEWLAKNPMYMKDYKAKYRKDNKEKIKKEKSEYYRTNKKVRLAYGKKWREENLDRIYNLNAQYKSKKLDSFENLSDYEKWIVQLYYKLSNILGENWHVDHIIPLSKGGKHHPDNLQLLLKTINLKKHNSLNFKIPSSSYARFIPMEINYG